MEPADGDGRVLSAGRSRLSVFVVTPACDGGVGAQTARCEAAGSDGAVLPDERVGLPVEVVAPARGRAAGEQPARVDVAGRDGGVLPDRCFQLSDVQTVRIAIVAPATDDSVGANPARVLVTGGDGGELSRGRARLSPVVIAPACDGAVAAQPAGVPAPRSHRRELPGGRVRLSDVFATRILVAAPTGDGAVGAQCARMPIARRDGDEPVAGSGVAGSGVVDGRAVVSVSTELASQRSTAAVVGKKRTRGNRRSPTRHRLRVAAGRTPPGRSRACGRQYAPRRPPTPVPSWQATDPPSRWWGRSARAATGGRPTRHRLGVAGGRTQSGRSRACAPRYAPQRCRFPPERRPAQRQRSRSAQPAQPPRQHKPRADRQRAVSHC